MCDRHQGMVNWPLSWFEDCGIFVPPSKQDELMRNKRKTEQLMRKAFLGGEDGQRYVVEWLFDGKQIRVNDALALLEKWRDGDCSENRHF